MTYQKITSQNNQDNKYWEEKQLRERASIEKQVSLKMAVAIVIAYKDKMEYKDAIVEVERLAIRLYQNVLYLSN